MKMKQLILSVFTIATLTVPLEGAGQDVTAQNARKLEAFGKIIADGGARASMVAGMCRREWESDFRMQSYCREQQEIGFRDFGVLWNDRVVGNETLLPAGLQCVLEWEDNGLFDFRMIHYCLGRQVEAYDSLR